MIYAIIIVATVCAAAVAGYCHGYSNAIDEFKLMDDMRKDRQ